MVVIGFLTALLKPEHIAKGYTLTEDEDFLYLNKDGKVFLVYSSHIPNLDPVHKAIEEQIKKEEKWIQSQP